MSRSVSTPLSVRALVAAYRAGLCLYPRAFRARFRAELATTFRDAALAVVRRRGLLGLSLFALRTLLDLVTQGAAERFPASDLNRPGGTRRLPLRPAHPHSLSSYMDALVQDVVFAWRMLRRSRALTATIILTLGLGIGAVTVIFTAVNGIILRPLPYPEADRLVAIFEGGRDDPLRGAVSFLNFRDWQAMSHSFEALGNLRGWRATLTGVEQAESLTGARVSHELLSVLGVRPAAGRTFRASDDKVGSGRVAMISYQLWQRQLAGRASAIGEHLALNDLSWEIIGVLPPGFTLPGFGEPQVLAPSGLDGREITRGSHFLNVVGRLARGVELEAANNDLARISSLLEQEYPDSNHDVLAWAQPLVNAELGDTPTRLLLLLGAVCLVLVIAVANVANLLLARCSARRDEIAVRIALGAGTRRLTRQLLTEAILLAGLGGLAGMALATLGTSALVALAPGDLPRLHDIGWDGRVVGFAALVTLISGVLFGTAPALHAVRSGAGAALRSSRGRLGRSGHGMQRGLVVGQIAIALTLLIGSGLLLNSLFRLITQNPGFASEGILTARIRLGNNYPGTEPQQRFFTEVLERLETAPGVAGAGAIFLSPFSGGNVSGSFTIVGAPEPEPGDEPSAAVQSVSSGFFELMRVPLLAGRTFDAGDGPNGEPVVVINETAARMFWPDADPIGRMVRAHVTLDDQEVNVERRIVGVVGDFRHRNLEQAPQPFLYMPFQQYATVSMYVYLRSSGKPEALAAPLRDVVKQLDPNVLVYRIATLEGMISDTVAEDRFAAVLIAAFALVAAILSCVGIYGVIAFSVAERTNEIGVRMALGATAARVRTMVLRETAVLAATGLGIGLLGSFWLSRLLQGLLHGVTPTDPATFGAMALLLLLMAFLAAAIPARRATRVDPAQALRD